ncbi:hypothetical protein OG806_39800 [Streptomyces sp. NBC_00882]|uniref:hypothetical protein n=1 Tax=Streptomyces TaxID=1883 RepID=UPI003863D9E3|nr:hypothetical protein OG806_39800 [Streptomyces sp. NBC_00882]WSZ62079.1 hypothetical protein OH824_38710 [Streptomyces canus]
MTRWILSRPEALTEIEELRLKAALAHCPELDALTGHDRSFAPMLTERQGEPLPQWLDAVRQDDLSSLHTLAVRTAVVASLLGDRTLGAGGARSELRQLARAQCCRARRC